jgi:tRNA A37 N6-isopentenylltransferase MiaA
MKSQEYEQSLDYTKNKVNLNYQMARVTIKENLSQFTQTQKKYQSENKKSDRINDEKILSQQNLNKDIPYELFNTNELEPKSK